MRTKGGSVRTEEHRDELVSPGLPGTNNRPGITKSSLMAAFKVKR